MPLVRPGVYNVQASAGPSWDFGDQDKGGEGTVVHLSANICKDWATQLWDEILAGGSGNGTWSPTRSCAVQWPSAPDLYYYKCGDEGNYDLKCTVQGQFQVDELHDAVCAFCHCLKVQASRSDGATCWEYERMLQKLRRNMDEEWGRFDRLLREYTGAATSKDECTTGSTGCTDECTTGSTACTDKDNDPCTDSPCTNKQKIRRVAEAAPAPECKRFRLSREYMTDADIDNLVACARAREAAQATF